MKHDAALNPKPRNSTQLEQLRAALASASMALQLVASDTRDSYLANPERQDAVERRLMRFGDAVKVIPMEVLTKIDPEFAWSKPIRFRDLAAHWYDGSLNHDTVWLVLMEDLPKRVASIERYLAAQADADERP